MLTIPFPCLIQKGLELDQMPMFVSADSNLVKYIIPVNGKPLTFTASAVILPSKYKSLVLVPFYKVQQSRYVIYWQSETPQHYQAIRSKLAFEEAAAAKLANITVDIVATGEQQPEADHFIESEDSRTGDYKGCYFRDAKGWFSYKMSDTKQEARKLRVTYYGRDKDRNFSILVNGQMVAEEELQGDKGDMFYTIDYTIPQSILDSGDKGHLTVKFFSNKGSAVAPVYEVRLLKI